MKCLAKCTLCGREFKRIASHLLVKHDIDIFDYLRLYCDPSFDISDMYNSGLSANQIIKKIKEEHGWFSATKKEVYKKLRSVGITPREISEATKEWVKSTGGIWNKGLTKEEHPSIMAYAMSRTGTNNGYYTGSEESRQRIRNWHLTVEPEKLREIRKKSGESLKKKIQRGTCFLDAPTVRKRKKRTYPKTSGRSSPLA
jgi:hypothetical protein